MAVRIVADYWQNYEHYKDVIKRCFYSLIQKFRIDDDYEAVFDTVLLELHRHKIFTRFDASKVDTTSCSVEKKFEQYLYMWINQALSNIYSNRGKQKRRFPLYGTMQDFVPESEPRSDIPVNPKGTSDNVKYPWYAQIYGFYVSEKEEADSSVFYKEMVRLVRARLSEDKRVIFDLILKDLSPRDVARMLGKSSELVYRTIREYRLVARKLLQKQLAKPTTV